MKRTRFVSSLCVAALAAAAGGTAGAAETSKDFTTARWKMKVPASWRLHEACTRGADKAPSTWTLTSKNRNVQLKVTMRPDKGTKLATLAERSLSSLGDRLRDMEIVKKDTTVDDGRDVFYALAKGVMKRHTTYRDYLVYRLVTRSKSQKAIITITLAASGERIDQFMALVESIMQSFDVVGAAPAAQVKK